MTARDEILKALPRLRARLGRSEFTPAEMVDELRRAASVYTTLLSGHTWPRECAETLPTTTRSYSTTSNVWDMAATGSGSPENRGTSEMLIPSACDQRVERLSI